MNVKVGKRLVSVSMADCADRDCFCLGFDKGTFSPGRGYTSYHTDAKGRPVEHPVCMTRHLNGCPMNSICPKCRTVSPRKPGELCDWGRCATPLEPYEAKAHP